MHPNQRFFLRLNITLYQRQLGLRCGFVSIGKQIEFAVCRLHLALRNASTSVFVMHAVFDQIGDGAYLQTVLFWRTGSDQANVPSPRLP